MSRARVIYHLMRADFLDRVRRYSFLVTLGLSVWLGWAVCTGKLKLWVADYRGIYNSAWVGVLMAMVINTFVGLLGFYVVKSSVERDRRTGVGQILATTPMSKPLYTLGKALSNLAVLLAMVAVLAGMAVVAQFMAGEETRVEPWALLAPFVFLCVPAMAVVASLAVTFETIPFLRGGFGNVVWFFVWIASFPLAIQVPGTPDPFGLTAVTADLFAEVHRRFGITSHDFVLGGLDHEAGTHVFRWAGMHWTPGVVLPRLAWLGIAAGLALASALFFDRFDPARGRVRQRKERTRKASPKTTETAAETTGAVPLPVPVHLHPLPAGSRRFSFLGMLKAELRLLLQGQRWWWYTVAAGLGIAGLAAPVESVHKIVLPLAWIWPLLLWSPLGTRESRFGTDGLVFSAARPLARQLPAAWLAGLLLAVATGAGAGFRFALAGDAASVGAWLVGAAFIPTAALALGVWSGSSKPFEVVYLLLWYIGPLNQTPGLDFMGAVPAAIRAGAPLGWLAVTAALAAAAVVGRRRQLAGV